MERWRGALRQLGDAAGEVTWRYGSFEMDPTVPHEGVDARTYLEAKYDRATVSAMHERLAAVAAAEGLPLLDLSMIRTRPNTLDAHRLLAAALEAGRPVQQALADELFVACWAEGRDVGDTKVLTELAVVAGLHREDAERALAGEANIAAVREDERRANESGIRAVPTFVLDGHFAVRGAHPAEALAQALRHALDTAAG